MVSLQVTRRQAHALLEEFFQWPQSKLMYDMYFQYAADPEGTLDDIVSKGFTFMGIKITV